VPQTELPDISVIGNIVGLASSDHAADNRSDIVVRELELGLQGYLYPQVRADAFIALSKLEGIIPALESSHAIAHAMRVAKSMEKDKIVVVCLSGRGDKDANTVAALLGEKI
jgi:hypothetical protein